MCGKFEKEVSNPWVIKHEEVTGSMLVRVSEAEYKVKEPMTAMNTSRRLRGRVSVNTRRREVIVRRPWIDVLPGTKRGFMMPGRKLRDL